MIANVTDLATVKSRPIQCIFMVNLMVAARGKVKSAIPHGALRDANVISRTLARNVRRLGFTSTQIAARINALPTSNKLARLQKSR